MTTQRRTLFKTLALGAAAAASLGAPASHVHAQPTATQGLPLLRAQRLKPGDTIGLVSPSAATYERDRFEIAHENLKALGFKVKEGASLRARHGHFAGTDAQRSVDINTMFADPAVHGIVAMAGGSGATRMLHLLDHDLIRRNPKCFCGYSDITAVLNAVHAKTGLVCFHGQMAGSDWNEFSLGYFRRMLMEASTVQFKNPVDLAGQLTQTKGRTQTIRAGRARGRLLGGNLTVLTTLMGTPYAPDFRGSVLFLEDVNEHIYRVDRMLAHLRLAGVFNQLAGVVLGQFTDCKPSDTYGELPLEDVFDDYFKPLNIPVFSGSMFGHVRLKFSLPVGAEVEMNAAEGSMTLLQPAVL